jgi:ABC-type multidrug transport system ATPase subunit
MEADVHAKLVVRSGPGVGDEYLILKDVSIIGREQNVDIQIKDQSISRRHARINYLAGVYRLEDLQSSNGTYINGQLVAGNRALRSGDQIRLGETVHIEFIVVEESESDVDINGLTRIDVKEQNTQTSALRHLTVTATGMPPYIVALQNDRYTLGREEDNDIVIRSKIVSRHHAILERQGYGYDLVVLPEAANRFLYRERSIVDRHRLYDGDEISVESVIADQQVTLIYSSPGEVRPIEIPRETYNQRVPPTNIPSDRTMLEAEFELEIPSVTPQLIVTVAGMPSRTTVISKERMTIGRAEDNDIVLNSPIVSRHHAYLERSAGGYQLVLLPHAQNGLVCQGKPITERVRIRHGDVFRIDSEIPGLMVSMVYQSPGEAPASELHPIQFGAKDNLSFGRDPVNDVQLNAPTVSRFHAEVERVGNRYRLVDLRSANGVFVNDERVERDVWLNSQDSIRIGPYRFILGENQFTRFDESSGLKVEALGLNKYIKKNVNILANISLVFQPREFVVVVGQSGGGKSTLVDAIAGYRPASHGRVLVNGIDVYKNFDAIRNDIGYVPQRDIIHTELTVYQALDYSARLRMPRDTSKDERHKRIMEVLEDLDLVHRKDTQISRLSGGQIKRVSIGVELLTRPGLFFLDEPTSGLDPGTETAFMHLMRRLADQGRTIILVTHATKNVMLADKVVFLARGGFLAWFGPPEQALTYFDQFRTERERRGHPMEFDQIYAILDDPSKGSAAEWAKRFQEHPAYQQYISLPLESRRDPLPLQDVVSSTRPFSSRKKSKGGRVSSLRQFGILSGRNVKILTRDRSSLTLMLAAAPLVAMLDFIIAPLMGKAPFNYATGDAANASITLFLLTIYCLLVAGLSQMREFVKEGDIYRRERMVNLRILPYVSSKVWVALLLSFYHGAAYTIIHYLAFDMPGGSFEFGLFYVTMILAAMAGMMCGLLASALAPAASSAPMIMILILVPQIVLSGALAPVPPNISAIAPTRWAFEGLIGITGIGADVAADPCWRLDESLRESMSEEDKDAFGCRCSGLSLFETGKCNFPGIGQYYEPELDQPEPVQPQDLPGKPPEPAIPIAPEPPADQFDQVAIAQYLNSFQSYQEDVARIQEDYKNQMRLYEAQANIYKEEIKMYQEDMAKWTSGRSQAIKGAEGLIKNVKKEFGWAFVGKSETDRFLNWMVGTWMAQFTIMFILFVSILLLIKRKDVK